MLLRSFLHSSFLFPNRPCSASFAACLERLSRDSQRGFRGSQKVLAEVEEAGAGRTATSSCFKTCTRKRSWQPFVRGGAGRREREGKELKLSSNPSRGSARTLDHHLVRHRLSSASLLPRAHLHVSDQMPHPRRVGLHVLHVLDSRSPLSSPLTSRDLLQLLLQLPQPRGFVGLRHVLMHVQPTAIVAEAANRDGPALLAGGEEAEEDAVSRAVEEGGCLAVVAEEHVAAIGDAIGEEVPLQGLPKASEKGRRRSARDLDGVRVDLTSEELRALGLHQQREGEVADAGIQVHHRLSGSRDSSHPRPLIDVPAAIGRSGAGEELQAGSSLA
mmetsp:Transcript_29849/g.95507  ORF Transcript_29849/g.95507 Transcript_29849/m.95507 type:complete len:330 (-) Transcript_29849:633-1622(-)